MARSNTSSLAALIFSVCLGISGDLRGESPWNDSISAVAHQLGSVWCGTTQGQMQVGARTYTIVGYQIVQPSYEDYVVHLMPISFSLKEVVGAQFLRITHRENTWVVQFNGADPHPFLPSPDVKRALRLGSAFGLPLSSSLMIMAGDAPKTLQIITKEPIRLFPGIEGKIRLTVDKTTKFPLRLSAFGLSEWQGAGITDYKLSLAFKTYPRCKRPK
jgi:hypothetical protein